MGGQIGLELEQFRNSFLTPATEATPIITVTSEEGDAAPSQVVARAYRERMAGFPERHCLHAVLVNLVNEFVRVAVSLVAPELPDAVNVTFPLDGWTSGSPALPGMRQLAMTHGLAQDTLRPASVTVYQIGCNTVPAEVDTRNLFRNADFEQPAAMGGRTGMEPF